MSKSKMLKLKQWAHFMSTAVARVNLAPNQAPTVSTSYLLFPCIYPKLNRLYNDNIPNKYSALRQAKTRAAEAPGVDHDF